MQISEILQAYGHHIIIATSSMVIVLLLGVLYLYYRLNKIESRYKKMMRGVDACSLETMLVSYVENVSHVVKRVEQLTERQQHLADIAQKCVQGVGLIRFNAFEDMGSELSFAVALLDADGNGAVISNISGRNDSRVYAKAVKNSSSEHFLTDEEKNAIMKAKRKIGQDF